MKTPEISIVVPVFRAESFLHICVDSILCQTYEDFELILVDDGSPDKSGDICDNYLKKDGRIHVIHQENHGVSYARNSGIQISRGRWLCFVDSDDYIAPTYLEDFMDMKEADLRIQGYRTICGKAVLEEHKFSNVLTDRETVLIEGEQKYIINSPCFKLFKTDLIKENNILFDTETSYGEDHLFTMLYLKYSKTITTSVQMGYYQVISSNESLSRGIVAPEMLMYYITQLRQSISEIFSQNIHHELLAVYNQNTYNHFRRYNKNFFLVNKKYEKFKEQRIVFLNNMQNYIYGIGIVPKAFYFIYTCLPSILSYSVFYFLTILYKHKNGKH